MYFVYSVLRYCKIMLKYNNLFHCYLFIASFRYSGWIETNRNTIQLKKFDVGRVFCINTKSRRKKKDKRSVDL